MSLFSAVTCAVIQGFATDPQAKMSGKQAEIQLRNGTAHTILRELTKNKKVRMTSTVCGIATRHGAITDTFTVIDICGFEWRTFQ